MPMAVSYTVIDGEIVSETRGGVSKAYAPDSLGSTIALYDASGNITDTWEYWPYGEVRTRTGTTPTPFQYVGTLGYYTDSTGNVYVRARIYQPKTTRWMSVDPLWPEESAYGYAGQAPTLFADPSGMQMCQGAALGAEAGAGLGPLGMLLGALLGAAVGLIVGDKLIDLTRPGRGRKLTRKECDKLRPTGRFVGGYHDICDIPYGGYPKAPCDLGMPCAEIIERAFHYSLCATLRRLFRDDCLDYYKMKRDKPHDDAIADAYEKGKDCHELAVLKRCYCPVRYSAPCQLPVGGDRPGAGGVGKIYN